MLASVDDPRLVVVRNAEARGVAHSRKMGIQLAKAPWIAFIDDDDLWAPSKLASQLALLSRCPRPAWSCVGTVVVDADLKLRGAFHAPETARLAERVLSYNVIPGGGSGVIAPTALVRGVGGFDDGLQILADWDLWIRLALKAELVPVDEPLLAYTLHSSNMSSDAGRAISELAIIERRYDAQRAERGIHLERWRWLDWMAFNQRRAGARVAPARIYARQAIAKRRPRPALHALGAFVAPRHVDRVHRRRADGLSPEWRIIASQWLAPYGRTSRSADSRLNFVPPPADE
jgi:glycosyltransferase involved in cell wall biosynthesis